MATTDLKGLNRKLDALADSLTKDTRRLLNQVGMEGKKQAADAVKGDIGDLSMSNWRRNRPIQITTRYNILSPSSLEVVPSPRASGPLRVLEQGRRPGMSKGRRGRPPRPVSASRGKGTWSDATKKMDQELPKVVHEHTRATLRKLFG